MKLILKTSTKTVLEITSNEIIATNCFEKLEEKYFNGRFVVLVLDG